MLIPFGILSSAAGGVAFVGAGYFAGGQSGGDVATIDKLDFSTETVSALTDQLSDARWLLAGFSNSGVAGYAAGGISVLVATVDKISFADDTRSTLGTGLNTGLRSISGFANYGVAGYGVGGRDNTNTSVTTINRFAFPADTRTTLGTGLSSGREDVATFANTGIGGYSLGGGVAGGFPSVSTVDKFAFPAETRSTLGTGLSSIRQQMSGLANQGVAGYQGGGRNINTDVAVSTVDKFAFPSDTRTTLGTGLSNSGYFQAAAANSTVAGFFAGGITSIGVVDTLDKFAFPADTRSVSSATLSATIYGMAGFSNEGVF